MPKCSACDFTIKHQFTDDTPVPCPQCGKPIESTRQQSWKSIALSSIAAPFMALLIGCGVNMMVNPPGSTNASPDRTTGLVLGMIPFAVSIAGICAGASALVVARRRKYRGISIPAISGIVFNIAFLAFLIYLVVLAVRALASD